MAKQTTVADFIDKHIKLCGKSQKVIAEEAGFPRQNLITMLKIGTTKVPIARVPDLARALDVDPATFMRLVLQEYQPEILEAIEWSLGEIKIKPSDSLRGRGKR